MVGRKYKDLTSGNLRLKKKRFSGTKDHPKWTYSRFDDSQYKYTLQFVFWLDRIPLIDGFDTCPSFLGFAIPSTAGSLRRLEDQLGGPQIMVPNGVTHQVRGPARSFEPVRG